MKVSRADLDWAAGEGLLAAEQVEPLWASLQARTQGTARFDLPNVLYYFGALVVISAMGWFMTLGWQRFGGAGLLSIAVGYALVFCLAGRRLWFAEQLRVPGGLLFVMAVCMTPLAVYGFEKVVGWWPQSYPGDYRDYYTWIKGGWSMMEVGTILAALAALRFIKFPFLTAPIAFSLWFMSMDLAPLLLGKEHVAWDDRLWISLGVGSLMLAAAYLVDRRTKEDYAFWGYLFGLQAFWGGLTLLNRSEWGWAIYCVVNLALILISVLIQRPVFIVFGALGTSTYLGHLSHDLFRDSMLFPFVLSAIGIAIIWLGLKYQRHRAGIEQKLQSLLPEAVRRQLPVHRSMSDNRREGGAIDVK